MLQYAIEHGMIDMSYVQEQMEMNKRKEFLRKHPYEIWEDMYKIHKINPQGTFPLRIFLLIFGAVFILADCYISHIT